MKTIEDVPYKSLSDKDNFAIIEIVKEGVLYSTFEKIYKQLPFTLEQWAEFLNTTTRTLQRWKRVMPYFLPHTLKELLRYINYINLEKKCSEQMG